MMKLISCILLAFLCLHVKAEDNNLGTPIKICTVYPHLKDSYWLSINYGMSEQAKRQGVSLKVLEAGGYQKVKEQWTQIEQCIAWQANAILVGAVYYEQLSEKLALLNKTIPLFGLVNELSTTELTAKTGVSWYEMGATVGRFLAGRHPKDSSQRKVKLAWFPGPKAGGGSDQSTVGLIESLENSNVEIVDIKYGFNEKINQFSLLKQSLNENNDLDYIAGNAVMAEMAISEINTLSTGKKPQILSHYLSHGVYRGIKRGKILMASSDQMVLQGKMAINQAVNHLKNKKITQNQAPEILIVTTNTLTKFPVKESLSPSNFKPIYEISN